MIISIYDLTTDDIRAEVKAAVANGSDPQALSKFVASVDWSRRSAESPSPMIVEMLGKLEAWTTEFSERDLSEREYTARLLGLLPESERRAPLASLAP